MRFNVVTGQRGYALPFALLSLVVFSILITVYFSILTNEYRVNNGLVKSWQARYVAESGVENALYNIKTAIENGGKTYAWDLTKNAFGADGVTLLPGVNDLNLAAPVVSSHQGTLKDTGGQPVGSYKWAVISNGTEPATPATTTGTATYQNTLTYNLVIESVGTLNSGGTQYRIGQSVQVTFVPLNIPDSAVNIQTVSQQTVTTKFAWEN